MFTNSVKLARSFPSRLFSLTYSSHLNPAKFTINRSNSSNDNREKFPIQTIEIFYRKIKDKLIQRRVKVDRLDFSARDIGGLSREEKDKLYKIHHNEILEIAISVFDGSATTPLGQDSCNIINTIACGKYLNDEEYSWLSYEILGAVSNSLSLENKKFVAQVIFKQLDLNQRESTKLLICNTLGKLCEISQTHWDKVIIILLRNLRLISDDTKTILALAALGSIGSSANSDIRKICMDVLLSEMEHSDNNNIVKKAAASALSKIIQKIRTNRAVELITQPKLDKIYEPIRKLIRTEIKNEDFAIYLNAHPRMCYFIENLQVEINTSPSEGELNYIVDTLLSKFNSLKKYDHDFCVLTLTIFNLMPRSLFLNKNNISNSDNASFPNILMPFHENRGHHSTIDEEVNINKIHINEVNHMRSNATTSTQHNISFSEADRVAKEIGFSFYFFGIKTILPGWSNKIKSIRKCYDDLDHDGFKRARSLFPKIILDIYKHILNSTLKYINAEDYEYIIHVICCQLDDKKISRVKSAYQILSAFYNNVVDNKDLKQLGISEEDIHEISLVTAVRKNTSVKPAMLSPLFSPVTENSAPGDVPVLGVPQVEVDARMEKRSAPQSNTSARIGASISAPGVNGVFGQQNQHASSQIPLEKPQVSNSSRNFCVLL